MPSYFFLFILSEGIVPEMLSKGDIYSGCRFRRFIQLPQETLSHVTSKYCSFSAKMKCRESIWTKKIPHNRA